MIRLTSSWLIRILTFNRSSVRAMCIGPFIIFRDQEIATNQRTNIHETIHFLQQLEMLFVLMWIAYAWFYISKRFAGKGHWYAYRYNPFEQEAYDKESELDYLIKRKPYSWVRYVSEVKVTR